MKFAIALAVGLFTATPILPDAQPRHPVQVSSQRYCVLDYFDMPNAFIPCEYVPLLTPRTGKPPLPPGTGKYGRYLDPGQDI